MPRDDAWKRLMKSMWHGRGVAMNAREWERLFLMQAVDERRLMQKKAAQGFQVHLGKTRTSHSARYSC